MDGCMSEEINKPEEMNTNTSAESKWYVVHTYSGYENKVKANIEKTVENRGMQHLIHEVSVPLQDVVEIKDGQKKTVQRKVFPGYVLLKMIMVHRQKYQRGNKLCRSRLQTRTTDRCGSICYGHWRRSGKPECRTG